jgi:hypothetical protein
MIDNSLYDLKKQAGIDSHKHAGPLFGGQQFSRIIRAATNQLRHVHQWKADATDTITSAAIKDTH